MLDEERNNAKGLFLSTLFVAAILLAILSAVSYFKKTGCDKTREAVKSKAMSKAE